jgi:hypothetical protein
VHKEPGQLLSQSIDVQPGRLAHQREIGMVFEQVFLSLSFEAQGPGNQFSNRAHHDSLPQALFDTYVSFGHSRRICDSRLGPLLPSEAVKPTARFRQEQ